jgi:hypothetical protein
VPALKTGEVVVELGVGENVVLLALDPRSGQARWFSELRSLEDRGAMLRIKDLAVGPDAAWVTGYFAGRIGSEGITLRAPPDIHHPRVDMVPANDMPVWPLFLFRQPLVHVERPR